MSESQATLAKRREACETKEQRHAKCAKFGNKISYTFLEVTIVIFTYKHATNSSTHFSMRTPSTNNKLLLLLKGKK